MIDVLPLFNVLAQQGGEQSPGTGFGALLMPLVAIAVLWYFLLFRPQKREQARRDEMLQNLKKNDRVVTIGGILGSVANLSADGHEVTLKVDDNTRIKLLKSSIQRVITDEDQGETGGNK